MPTHATATIGLRTRPSNGKGTHTRLALKCGFPAVNNPAAAYAAIRTEAESLISMHRRRSRYLLVLILARMIYSLAVFIVFGLDL